MTDFERQIGIAALGQQAIEAANVDLQLQPNRHPFRHREDGIGRRRDGEGLSSRFRLNGIQIHIDVAAFEWIDVGGRSAHAAHARHSAHPRSHPATAHPRSHPAAAHARRHATTAHARRHTARRSSALSGHHPRSHASFATARHHTSGTGHTSRCSTATEPSNLARTLGVDAEINAIDPLDRRLVASVRALVGPGDDLHDRSQHPIVFLRVQNLQGFRHILRLFRPVVSRHDGALVRWIPRDNILVFFGAGHSPGTGHPRRAGHPFAARRSGAASTRHHSRTAAKTS